MNARLQISNEDLLLALQDQGVPPEHYAFKCVRCGNIQSAASLGKYMSADDAFARVYSSCEGRFTKERGCDWTLGGLFQIHKMEVLKEDTSNPVCGILRAVPIFEPASREEAQELMRHTITKEDMEPSSGQVTVEESACAVPSTVPVTINVCGGEAIIRAPWWIIMDLPTFRKRIRIEMEGNEYASVDEVPDDDLSACIVECFRGPFFSRAEAEAALPLCAHRCYYKKPEIECVSGGHNPAFDAACAAARKANNAVERKS